jgi:hypothetical protein
MTRRLLSRRDWLRSVGAAGALFPFLRPRPARAQVQPKLVLLMQNNGTHQANFWPTTAGTLSSPILDPLVSVAPVAARTTLIKGVYNDAGGSGNGHDQGFAGLYSGYRTVGDFNDPWGNGISLDQLLKKSLTFSEPFPTLNCGVLASDSPVFKTHRRSFSYTGPGRQVPTETNPYRLYARFFAVGPRPSKPEDAVAFAQRRLMEKRTVLDHASAELKALRGRVGKLDREKLDAHETALREMERRLGATLMPDPNRPPRCVSPTLPALGLDVTDEDNVPMLVPIMFDFVALALSCGLTRIVTFQFGNGGDKWYFRWLGINENSHDDLAHRDHGTDPVVSDKITRMNVWYAQQVSHLAQAMHRLPQTSGTLLDESLVVWGNELATGPHGMRNLPIVLLGGAAGRLKQTGVLVDAGQQDYHRLGTSLLNVMGVPAAGFGEAPTCGPMAGLEMAAG